MEPSDYPPTISKINEFGSFWYLSAFKHRPGRRLIFHAAVFRHVFSSYSCVRARYSSLSLRFLISFLSPGPSWETSLVIATRFSHERPSVFTPCSDAQPKCTLIFNQGESAPGIHDIYLSSTFLRHLCPLYPIFVLSWLFEIPHCSVFLFLPWSLHDLFVLNYMIQNSPVGRTRMQNLFRLRKISV